MTCWQPASTPVCIPSVRPGPLRGWGDRPPQRVGALWPGRLSFPNLAPAGSPLAEALKAAPPLLWQGRSDARPAATRSDGRASAPRFAVFSIVYPSTRPRPLSRNRTMSLRLIDLHTDWLLQYAPETTVFDPALYPSIPQRLGQAEGYLQTTWAAVLSCYQSANEWERQGEPWRALADLITRYEAEFCGRLLIGRGDLDRWLLDRDGLAWGMIGVEGFDALVRSNDDLQHLPRLFERGVRLFQPVYSATSVLAGSSAEGDDRGLSALGVSFLETLAALAEPAGGPRPIVDLANLNPTSAGDILAWFEADEARTDRLIPVYSHGALAHEGFAKPRAITLENLLRPAQLGGVVGLGVTPPFYDSPAALKASIEAAARMPFRGQAGFEGIAIGTDFLGVDRTLPGLANAAEVVAWLESAFDAETALAIAQGNALRLLKRVLGADERRLGFELRSKRKLESATVSP